MSEHGEPLRVLHGTGCDFGEFDPVPTGSMHLDALEGEDDSVQRDGSAFYFNACERTAFWYARDSARCTTPRGTAVIVPVYLRVIDPLIIDFAGERFEYLAEELVRAKALACDGLIARNCSDGSVSDHYVAFDARQIKSAIGNSGLYLPTSASLDDRAAALGLGRVASARGVIRLSDRAGRPVMAGGRPE